jgi:signal transduction histidine kinase
MKRERIRLAQQYEAAMRKYVKVGSRTGLPLARAVAKQAATLGLRALDLARLHDQALAQFAPPVTRDGASHRADAFFAEAFTQLGQRSPSARKTAARLRRLNKQLRQRTMDLATSRRIRKKDLVDRNVLRDALKKKTAHYASLLAESRDLQRCLQRLTRRMLSAQENERTTISRTLRDDVAQAMLGIQVKLAHLKTEAARNTTGLRRELTATQRLVEKSTKTLEQFAGELG